MKKLTLIFALVPILLGGGCVSRKASESKSAEQVAASHESTIKQALRIPAPQITPPRTVSVSGASNVVTITETFHAQPTLHADSEPAGMFTATTEIQDGAATSGSASSDAKRKSSFTLPLSVSLLIGGVALIILTALVWFWRHSSASVKAATDAGDAVVAAAIRRLRERAAVSTNFAEIAMHQTDIAHLESERGKLASQ